MSKQRGYVVLDRRVCGTLVIALTLSTFLRSLSAADRPMVEAVIDRDSGGVLWSIANPTAATTLKPGQEILLRGRNLGPGPITAARPGLGPPAALRNFSTGSKGIHSEPGDP